MLLFQDSYDDRTLNLYLKYDDWRVVNGTPFVPSRLTGVTGMTDGCANFGVGAFGFNYLTKNIPARQTAIVAFRFRYAAASGSNSERLIEFKNGSTVHLYVRRNAGSPASTYSVYRGDDTLLGTTTDTVDYNIVAHFQLKATIDNSVGSYELRINGTTVLSGSAVDTQNAASAVVDNIKFGSLDGVIATYIDDFMILDTLGSYNNNFPGNAKIACLQATGVGSHSAFTRTGGTAAGNYTAINESDYDDDTSFVSSPNVSDTDTYSMRNVPDATAAIKAVTIYTRARKDDSLLRAIAPVLITNSSEITGSTINLSTSYTDYWGILYETNPGTGQIWNASEINAMELGVKVAD